jgi:hypothetical protein
MGMANLRPFAALRPDSGGNPTASPDGQENEKTSPA